jgi:hypothetical protein
MAARRTVATLGSNGSRALLLIDNPEWPLVKRSSPIIPGSTGGTFFYIRPRFEAAEKNDIPDIPE